MMRFAQEYLTDDEVVAISLQSGGRWPLPLPTLDAATAGDLEASGRRGLRSLVARRVIEGDAEAINNADYGDLGVIPHAQSCMTVYLGDERGRPVSWDLGIGVVRVGASWVLDTFSAAGLHQFAELESEDDVVSFVANIAAGVQAEGLADPSSLARLCITVGTPAGGQVATVSVDSVRLLTLDGTGSITSDEEVAADIDDVVRKLVDHLDTATA